MNETALAKTRRRAGIVLTVGAALGLAWWLSPGLPVWRGPRAGDREREGGRLLFVREWLPRDPVAHGDGLGPVFNERSCVACHFQGGVGGGGGNDHNVVAFEALPTRERPELEAGLVHKYAVIDPLREGFQDLRRLFPIVPGGLRVEGGCQIQFRDFDPVRIQRINTTALFGAGWIDRIDGKAVLHAYRGRSLERIGRELAGDFDAMPPGRPRVLADGRVGKFGWKAQFATLEEFVAAACANEIGLGNPMMPQAEPRSHAKYLTRPEPDLDREQFRHLVAFVDTLPAPREAEPSDAAARAQAERGRGLFQSIGCASCHTPDLGGVRGLYSDLLLHRLDDPENSGYSESTEVPLPEELPLAAEWKTPPLWGVADSAPYFHDGDSPTLESAILRHRGDAGAVRESFVALPPDDRSAILAFLGTLRAPAEAEPVAPITKDRIALAR